MGGARYLRAVCASLVLLPELMAPATSPAQTPRFTERHDRGQSVVPSFEGWEPNADGTFSLYFGYMNRNYEEKLDIPVGPDNLMEPGPDRGQPAHFLTRRHRNVFSVVVPKDFGDKRIVWTLSIRGNTEKATGSLNPIYQIDVSRDRNTGNTPPVIKSGPDQTITLPAAVTLTVAATDDGLPKQRGGGGPGRVPGAPARAREAGLTVEWTKYRGPGNVTFAPVTQEVVDGNATTQARFSAPGVYTVNATASDGRMSRPSQIRVTVAAAPATAGQR
jgi:hypothetical protein